jgi:hypothetical protein
MPINTKRRQDYADKQLLANALASGRDDLLAAAVQTKAGAAAMPMCAKAFGLQAHFDLLKTNAIRLLKQTGGRHKVEVAHLLTDGLPPSFCKKELGLSKEQVLRFNYTRKQTPTEQLVTEGRKIVNAKYAEGTTRHTRHATCEGLGLAMTAFFKRTTHQCSGANVEQARILDKDYWVWDAELQSQWPGILRDLADRRPDLLPDCEKMPKTGWTLFQANMLSAVHNCPTDPQEERATRYRASVDNYLRDLAKKNGNLPNDTDEIRGQALAHRQAQTAARLSATAFDLSTHDLKAPTLTRLRLWLKDEGHHYTRYTVPHPCELCTEGPANEVVFKHLQAKLFDFGKNGETPPGELVKKCNDLRAKLRLYRVHVRQLKECRAAVKVEEETMMPGTAMVIRDFVNHHDHSGSHVKCLHWVLMWRNEPGGPIERLKLRHYCSDTKSLSTDSYYQADVTNFHLDELNEHCPKLFKDFHTIIMVGDHGPHFASHETMHNESTLERKYGKRIRLMFLTSYHAYSRADGAGAEDSTALRKDLIAGLPRFGAKAMVNMTNSSHDQASWAYWFPAINRNEDVFPPHKHFAAKDRAKWIRKWTEVKFDRPDNSPMYDGYLQYRLVTGQGPWQWTDLVAATRTDDQTMCDACSTKQQTTVLHTTKDCPCPAYIHNMPTFKDLLPDKGRIEGRQMAQKSTKEKKKGFPCKYKDCITGVAFRKPHTANRHMLTVHEPTDAQYLELAYPDPTATTTTEPLIRPKKPISKKAATDPKARPVQPKKRVRVQARGQTDSNDEEDDEDDDVKDSEDHDTTSEDDVHDDDEGDDEDDDDGALAVGAQGVQYEFESIDAHRLLASGSYNYLIKWVGYARRTWEGAVHLGPETVAKYHRDVEQKQADKNIQTAAARIASGAKVRNRRGAHVPNHEDTMDRIDTRVDAMMMDGVSYYQAYENAQAEIALEL